MKSFHWIGVLSVLAVSVTGFSQTDDYLTKQGERAAKSPSDVAFQLALANGKNRFHPGEMIQLELRFTSSSSKKYTFDNRSYDRSGRLEMDSFVFDHPADITDPLYDYYHRGPEMFMAGGLFSTPNLGNKPQVIDYTLNEWFRFDKPGTYRLYIVSPRISIGEPYSRDSTHATVVSNVVQFEILPADTVWEQRELARATGILDSTSSEADIRRACEILRHLDTEAAAREIIDRFNDDYEKGRNCSFNFYMGLQGSTHRQFIVEEMQKKLVSPNFSVSDSFLAELSLLSYFVDHPEPLPDYPTGQDAVKQREWQEKREEAREQKLGEREKYMRLLRAAIDAKTGAASPESIYTLFTFGEGVVTAEDLISVLAELSPEKQQTILTYHWDKIKAANTLPVLRDVYNRSKDNGHNDPFSNPTNIALRRIFEIDPREGRELILAELQRSSIRISEETWKLLPEEENPELTALLLTRTTDLQNDFDEREKALRVLGHYGTVSALPKLRSIYGERLGLIECGVEEAYINYLFRFEPNAAVKAVSKVMSSRAKTGCYNSQFADIDAKYWSHKLESVALEHLHDRDVGVVKAMVDVLAKRGSAAAKEKIWNSFEEFSREQRKDPVVKSKKFGEYSYPLHTIEQTYVDALSTNKNWKLTALEFEKLAQLCITEDCKANVKNHAEQGHN